MAITDFVFWNRHRRDVSFCQNNSQRNGVNARHHPGHALKSEKAHRRMIQENTQFRSLGDAVNGKAIAAKLPSARLHLSASKLEPVLVKHCLTQCLLAKPFYRREQMRRLQKVFFTCFSQPYGSHVQSFFLLERTILPASTPVRPPCRPRSPISLTSCCASAHHEALRTCRPATWPSSAASRAASRRRRPRRWPALSSTVNSTTWS